MCLAIPGKILQIKEGIARVSIDGVGCDAGLAIAEDVHVGDYVIVHAGFILQKLSPQEAQEELEAIQQAAEPPASAPPFPNSRGNGPKTTPSHTGHLEIRR